MNRRLKLLILVLMFAVLILSAAILSFRLASPAGGTPEPEAQPAGNRNSVTLFEGASGLWGAANANGRVLIEPNWRYLRIMSDSVLIARKNGSKSNAYGLIRTNGEPLVAFIYHSITQAAAANPDLWIAVFEENGRQYYHLYHADGTRWSDTAWDACNYTGGTLTLESGSSRREGVLHDRSIEWTDWQTEYPVGLHALTVGFDEAALKRLPPVETLDDIGEASAAYLRYLFITKQPDASMMPQENSAGLRTDYRYISCRLVSAEISRVKALETEGLPSYFVQMQVKYQVLNSTGGIEDVIRTSMQLTLTRNASTGALTYTGFSDAQMRATGAVTGRKNTAA